MNRYPLLYSLLIILFSLLGMSELSSNMIGRDMNLSLKRNVFSSPVYDSLKTRQQSWTAEQLWMQSTSQNLKFSDNSIIQEDILLIENDAGGLGSIRSEAWDTLSKGIIIRKYLELPLLPVTTATISMLVYPVFPAEPMSGGMLEFKVNGHKPIIYELRHFWASVPVPAEYLIKGKNLIEIKAHNQNEKFRIPMALSSVVKTIVGQPTSYTGNSQRSSDQGKTWKYAGSSSNIAEYPVRLKIKASNKRAWLQTPVFNLADKGLRDVFYLPVKMEAASLQIDTLNSSGSNWQTRIRSGNTHVPEVGDWTDWRPVENGNLAVDLNHRFVQIEFSFESNSGIISPKIQGLRLNTKWRSPDNSDNIFVSEVKNYPLIRSSFEFRHENPSLPALQEFRKQFQLDKIVEGAKTELDKIKRLRAWVAGSWDWFLPNPELNDLLTWDARKILTAPDKSLNLAQKGGNCLHYAIVFAQACQSFGIPARIVNTNYAIWGGHELVEVWSGEFEKWIMVDPNFDSMFYGKQNGVPLNILELHQVFLETYYPGKELVDRDSWSFEDRDRRAEKIDPETLPIRMEVGGNAYSGQINKDYVWWKATFNKSNPGYSGGYGFYNTAEVRWLPRSNWLSQELPLPVTHGRTHWGWDGYYAWTDDQTPETAEHRYFVRRERDMYNRLFAVDFSALPVSEGLLEINMATDTPRFKHFEISVNGNITYENTSSASVKLSSGVNTIEIRSVDILGNQGSKSMLKVHYNSLN
ncbi:Transglutaminase-like enzyme, putative cysteine protease [Daejeonella rubra]|uniref:Transglutaminase-like enzyme, putative cysteine protease n=1 Tax=Daejeonella rubra TaxID=990371 RepID=A0A1G9SLA3_9SPHI|nr:transglutaminase-like domain-containing protein [Daejeonella rubra]SDM36202.1 Transglutaminase-like enzyme, putative cysteine protease [Daejeonella rubra]